MVTRPCPDCGRHARPMVTAHCVSPTCPWQLCHKCKLVFDGRGRKVPTAQLRRAGLR